MLKRGMGMNLYVQYIWPNRVPLLSVIHWDNNTWAHYWLILLSTYIKSDPSAIETQICIGPKMHPRARKRDMQRPMRLRPREYTCSQTKTMFTVSPSLNDTFTILLILSANNSSPLFSIPRKNCFRRRCIPLKGRRNFSSIIFQKIRILFPTTITFIYKRINI